MVKPYVYVCLMAMLITSLAFGSEVRKGTMEDMEWAGTPHYGSTTVTSAGGHVGHPFAPLAAVDVRQYGATDNTGATDESTDILAAINAALPGQPVIIPPGTWSFAVTLPNKDVTIYAHGATISSPSSSPVFTRGDHHGTLFKIYGASFTGAGTGLYFNMTPSGTMYWEYEIISCTFTMDTGVYGIDMRGTREGRIQHCDFYGPGNGWYGRSATAPFIDGCYFKGSNPNSDGIGRAIFADGDGLGTSSGPIITSTTVMGWEVGVEAKYCDGIWLTNSTVDYNDNSIILGSQDQAFIISSYIGTSSINANPAILIKQGDNSALSPDYSANIIITGSYIHSNSSESTSDTIRITGGPTNVTLQGNIFGFYKRYGVNIDNATYIKITNNIFDGSSATASIANTGSGGDSTWMITGNTLEEVPTGHVFAQFRDNIGYQTEYSGTATFNGASSVVVDHNMNVTPTSVFVTPEVNHPVWVDTITSTQFTVHTDNVYTVWGVYWRAEKMRGN